MWSFHQLRAAALIAIFFCVAQPIVLGAEPAHILVCGSAQVLEGVIDRAHGQPTFRVVWTWRPEHSAGLPRMLMSSFAGTDECKPVSDGKEILITSSGGALALVDHANGNSSFYASVPNAHSATLLPGGFLVAASSFSPDGRGDRFLLYQRSVSDSPVTFLPAKGAHGVEWDSKRNVLWALSDHELLRISVATRGTTQGQMAIEHSFSLPGRGGHDLVLAKDSSSLYVTTSDQSFVFLPETGKFSNFTALQGLSNLKSLSINPETGQILYTRSEDGVWWTYALQFVQPQETVVLSEHAYKARWYPQRFTTLLHASNTSVR